jgi:MazG family protein
MSTEPVPISPDLKAQDEGALQSLSEFLHILRRLRTDCPWDREQTHESLRPMLIEEAYETLEAIDHAIDTGDYTELKKELGDILLHILFHSELAREEGHFTLEEVIRTEAEKLIYRHPHVFGDVKVEGAEEVRRNWEQLKRRENGSFKGAPGRTSVLDGVPKQLPALQRAARIQDRASKVGFDWTDSHSVWEKVREEVFEFEAELGRAGSGSRVPGTGGSGNTLVPIPNSRILEPGPRTTKPDTRNPIPDPKTDEFGDLLFSLVNLARHEKLDPEHALRESTAKFERRFRQVEQRVEASGRPMDSFSLAELDAIWDEVKKSA